MSIDDKLRRARAAAPYIPVNDLIEIMRIAQEGMVETEVEDPGFSLESSRPRLHDADSKGFIEWKRSGQWLRHILDDEIPVDATDWRHTDLKKRELTGG